MVILEMAFKKDSVARHWHNFKDLAHDLAPVQTGLALPN